MDWVYLSPHLDDVALSVGGLLWEQSNLGKRVSVWTICAGDPPPGDLSPFAKSLQTRWETEEDSMSVRRAEDIRSCHTLGAEHLHFNIPDCIYRRSQHDGKYLYASEEALWIPVHPDEDLLVVQIADELAKNLTPNTQVVCPLTLGNHVDHRLTRLAAEKLDTHLLFYADYPYVLEAESFKSLENYTQERFLLSPQGLISWKNSISAHQSQISTFWPSLDDMHEAIQKYYQQMDGVKLFN